MMDPDQYTLLEPHFDMPEGTLVFWIRMGIDGQVVTSLNKEGTELRMVPVHKLKIRIH